MSSRRRSGAARRAKKAASGGGGDSLAEPESPIPQESSREVSTQQGFTTGCEDDEASAFGVEAKDLLPEEPVEGLQLEIEKVIETAATTTQPVADADEKKEAGEELIEQGEEGEGVNQENCEKTKEEEIASDAEQTGNAHTSKSDSEADKDEGEAEEREADQTEESETDGQTEEIASEGFPVLPEEQSRQQTEAEVEQLNQQQLQQEELQVPQENQQQEHEQQPQNTQEEQTSLHREQEEEEEKAQPSQQQLESQQGEQLRQEEEQQRQQLRAAEDTAADVNEGKEEEKQQEGEEDQEARGAVPQELREATSLDFSGYVRDVWEESEVEFGVAPSPSAAGVCCDGKSARNVCDQDAKALVWNRIPAAVSRYTAEAQQESVGDACLSCTGDVIDGCLPTTRLLSELVVAGSAALASLLYTYRCEICRGISCLLNSTYNCLKMCVCVVTPPPQEPRPAQRMPSINWVSLGESTEMWAPLEAAEFDRMQSNAGPRLSRQAIVGAPQPAGHPRSHSTTVPLATSALLQENNLQENPLARSQTQQPPRFRPLGDNQSVAEAQGAATMQHSSQQQEQHSDFNGCCNSTLSVLKLAHNRAAGGCSRQLHRANEVHTKKFDLIV
ncbi:hypothetical protein Emed_006131 [Eimeria media]